MTQIPIFMHIEHTGGTSMQDVLDRQYAEKDTFFFYMTHHEAPTTAFMKLSQQERDRFTCLRGHLYFGVHRWLSEPASYFTLMRHPYERVVSSYYYYMRKPRLKDHHRYVSGEMTWEKHLEEQWYTQAQLTRVHGGDDDLIQTYWVHQLPTDALETAKQHLVDHFAFVGLVERYDESLLLMRRMLGWQKSIYYARRNTAGSERRRFADLPAHIQRIIEQKTEPELKLYEFARARFEAQVEALGDSFQQELAAFKVENEVYGKRQLAWENRVNRVKKVARRIRDAVRPKK